MIPPPPPEATESGAIKLLRNDTNQTYIDSNHVPASFVRESATNCRFTQYPRWAKLLQAKDQVHQARVHPPQKIKCDLKTFDLASLNTQFDVILMDPPWEEYVRRTPDKPDTEGFWTLDELKELRIDAIASNPSFIFIWAGDTHLDDARALLNHWGYRRCEDITWLKTVPAAPEPPGFTVAETVSYEVPDGEVELVRKLRRVQEWMRDEKQRTSLGWDDETAVLRRVKEHCLMGLKGLVRRSLDGHFVHANIDTDVLIADAALGRDPDGLISTAKPVEMYEIIERFCLGRRKIELFGTPRCERAGWLTLGRDLERTAFHAKEYLSWFENKVEQAGGTWDTTSGTDAFRAAAFLGCPGTGMTPVQSGLFKAGVGTPGEQAVARDENPLANKNAYPNLTDYRGGRFEGTSSTLEFLRPKSPPSKPNPIAHAQNSPMAPAPRS